MNKMPKGISIALGILIWIAAIIIAIAFPEIGALFAFIIGFLCGIMGAALILPHIFLKQQ